MCVAGRAEKSDSDSGSDNSPVQLAKGAKGHAKPKGRGRGVTRARVGRIGRGALRKGRVVLLLPLRCLKILVCGGALCVALVLHVCNRLLRNIQLRLTARMATQSKEDMSLSVERR